SVCSANLAKCLIINVLRLIIVILFFIAFLNITYVSRHTFATLSLALGIDLYTVCKLLGHKNIISTQVYAKIIDASKRQAIDRFNGVLDA
ncbi:tyrosine-type recombinase/integrase, partial [Parabacteroides sp. merdae-related_45_40]